MDSWNGKLRLRGRKYGTKDQSSVMTDKPTVRRMSGMCRDLRVSKADLLYALIDLLEREPAVFDLLVEHVLGLAEDDPSVQTP